MTRKLQNPPIASVAFAPAAAHKAAPAASIHVEVARTRMAGNSFYAVNATAFARAAPQSVWDVLTAYDRLHQFVPNLRSSKLLSRDGHEAVIEQHARAGLLFIKQSIYLELRVVEQPISVIDITLVTGDMKRFDSHWELAAARQEATDGTLITYAGQVEPNFYVPALLGTPLIRSDVQNMVRAVIKEIEKSV